jgi:hypothetical protein
MRPLQDPAEGISLVDLMQAGAETADNGTLRVTAR